jgi:O-antigen/teichoic acid export membrane protein
MAQTSTPPTPSEWTVQFVWSKLMSWAALGRGGSARSVFIRHVGSTFAVRLVLIAIGLLTSALVARALGPEGRGYYGVSAVIVALSIQFGNLGMPGSNGYYVAADTALLPKLVSNSLVVTLVAGGGVSLAIAAVFAVRPSWSPLPQGALFYATLIWVPFSLGYLLLQNLLIGIREIRSYNLLEVVSRLSFILLLVVILLLRSVNVTTVVEAGVVSSAGAFVLALRRLLSVCGSLPSPDWALLRKQAAYGLRSYLAATFAYMVLKIDILMVKYLAGATQAGYYSLASSLTDLVNTFPSVVGMILFPTLTATATALFRWERARKAMWSVAGMMCVVAAAAAAFAHPLIVLTCGKAYAPAVPSLRILCFAIVFYAANNIVSIYFASSGYPWFAVWVWCGAAILNIALNLYAVPRYGIEGAAMASLLTYGAILLVQMAYAAVFTRDIEAAA